MRLYKPAGMLMLCVLTAFSTSACNIFGGSDDGDTDLLALGGLAALVVSSRSTVYTLDSTTGCITGQSVSMDSSLPDWIKNNFTCATGTVSGSNYVFTSLNLPNTNSFYYTTASPLYEALPSGNNSAGTNVISAQPFTYTIPASPTQNTGTLTSTQAGQASIGLTRNGLAMFNNAAAPGDTLASEVATFDNFNGHPQSSGIYHHHAQPLNITNEDSSLVGIALDGYPVYGRKCDNGTSSTGDDFTPDSTGTNVLDSLHGHTSATVHFPGGTYHYHAAQDSTATIVTLMGSSFYGITGSTSGVQIQ